ncbi:S8 family peptidase [Gluconobacter cerinus]|uniref:S8 family peptidase n=1 Tax=Gluconobacter cerinus TaxID=38307 RepID=UPI001B8AAA71|nr:S8 family peptidase [Gluconobacter cerinus]MBS0982163.1 S8 family peptidase [Gluconobacter cerinus]
MVDNTHQILPLRRTPDPKNVGRPIKGKADKRRRKSVDTDVQVARLGPLIDSAFANILDRPDIDVAKDPSALAPDRALVLEIIGRPESFISAAQKAGLEWLAEEVAALHGVTEYFEDVDDADALDAPESDETEGRLYLGMPTIASFERLRMLWSKYSAKQKAPEGDGVWWKLFSHLHCIRPWGAEDRLNNATRGKLKSQRERFPNEKIKVEVDLWYRGNPTKREEVYSNFIKTVKEIGGKILDELFLEEIRYHAALIWLPALAVDAIIQLQGPLAVADEIMSIRPQSSFRFGIDQSPFEAVPDTDGELEPPKEASIGAVIDGWPVENHELLRDRLDVIPLDVTPSMAPVNTRYHGTAMASLILRGDGHFSQPPISRRLKIVPVLAADNSGYESIPLNKLPLGLIKRAVEELKIGTNGQPPSGSDVVIINHSICDEAFGFTGTVSPWARLIDYLSYKYKVLFVVSAGNVSDTLALPAYSDAAKLRAAAPTERRDAIIRAVDNAKSQRTIFSPAESVNALTIAAAHSDGSNEPLPPNLADPFPLFAAPNLNSGLGLGFNRSVKPDIMLPGGRQVAHPTMSGGLRIKGWEAAAYFGQKVASPDPNTADLKMVRRSSGTSNAAALATRAGLLIGSILDSSPLSARDDVPWYRKPTAPCVLKALIAHGASWGEVGETMTGLLYTGKVSLPRAKEGVCRAIGYGQVNHERIIEGDRRRVTLLGQDLINKERRHEWRVPLPNELSSAAEFRRIIVTLAWLSPVQANSSNYRMFGLQLVGSDGLSSIWEGANRASYQPSVHSSQRGTLVHAIYEGKKAIPFDENGNFILNVQATSKLSFVSDIKIPYALAVTIEVADTISSDIRDEIRRRVGVRERARS